jgi:hypothetical protein
LASEQVIGIKPESVIVFTGISSGPTSFRETVFRVVDFSPDGRIQVQQTETGKGGPSAEQFQGTLDMRGCTYERIQLRWQSLFHQPDGSLRLQPYDRQPYTQLEEVFRKEGQDDLADAVYLDRRGTERKLKWHSSFGSWLLDRLNSLMTNYGVTPFTRLGLIALAFVLVGMECFAAPGAVDGKDRRSGASFAVYRLDRWEAFLVSVHCFLPVDIPAGSTWTPVNVPISVLGVSKWRLRSPQIRPSSLASGLRIIGWILVPVAVAALTGLLRYVGR